MSLGTGQKPQQQAREQEQKLLSATNSSISDKPQYGTIDTLSGEQQQQLLSQRRAQKQNLSSAPVSSSSSLVSSSVNSKEKKDYVPLSVITVDTSETLTMRHPRVTGDSNDWHRSRMHDNREWQEFIRQLEEEIDHLQHDQQHVQPRTSQGIHISELPDGILLSIFLQAKDMLELLVGNETMEKTRLQPHHSWKKLFGFNLLSMPLTALGAFLYLATTEGYDGKVVFSTTASNLTQNQYFMYQWVAALWEAGMSKEMAKRLFTGIFLSLPYGVSTYLPAVKNGTIQKLFGWDVGPFEQAMFQMLGMAPLNGYVLDDAAAVISEALGMAASAMRIAFCCQPPEQKYLAVIERAQKSVSQTVQDFIEDIEQRPARMDELDIKRKYTLPEQLNALNEEKELKPDLNNWRRLFEESWLCRGVVLVIGIGGAVFCVWSSIGYGGSVASVIGNKAWSHVVGQLALTPLYTLSAKAGASLSIIPATPFIIGRLSRSPLYRVETIPSIVALSMMTAVSWWSYGSSLELIKTVEPIFLREKVGEAVAQWFTVAFNSLYSALPVAAGGFFLTQWVMQLCCSNRLERQDKYKQLLSRKGQLDKLPVEAFMEVVQRLRSETLNKLLGEGFAKELREAMLKLYTIRRMKQAMQEFPDLSKDTIKALVAKGGGFYATRLGMRDEKSSSPSTVTVSVRSDAPSLEHKSAKSSDTTTTIKQSDYDAANDVDLVDTEMNNVRCCRPLRCSR